MTIGLSSYVPTYVQGVLGTGALVAGFTLAALTVGWPLAATFSGRIYIRIGFRDTALIGAAFVLLGAVLCTLLGPTTPVWQVGGACFVVGVGLGFLSSPVVVAVQSVVGWDRRGVVTGTNMFSPLDRQRPRRGGASAPSPTPRWPPTWPTPRPRWPGRCRTTRPAWCCRAPPPRPTGRPPTSSGRRCTPPRTTSSSGSSPSPCSPSRRCC